MRARETARDANYFRGINVPTQTNGSVCVCLCAYQSTINTNSECLLFRVVSCRDAAKWVRIALQHISYIFAIQCVLENSSRSLFAPRTHNPYLCTWYFAVSHPFAHIFRQKRLQNRLIYPWQVECESVPSDERAHHAKPREVGSADCVCFCSRAIFHTFSTIRHFKMPECWRSQKSCALRRMHRILITSQECSVVCVCVSVHDVEHILVHHHQILRIILKLYNF